MNVPTTHRPTPGPADRRATALLVTGWLPFFLALAQSIRLHPAFLDPNRTLEFLPGWPGFAGTARECGVNWLHLLYCSGSAGLLTWGLILERIGRGGFSNWPGWRWRVLAGPALAWLTLVVWGVYVDERYIRQEAWAMPLLLQTPALAVSYLVVGSGLTHVRSTSLWTLILVMLWTSFLVGQLQYERPRQNEPDEVFLLWGSLPIGLAVALRLAIWGWAEAPAVRPRVS